MKEDIIEKDRIETLKNREKLFSNDNLLYWYQKLYDRHKDLLNSRNSILEIGSGTSPLKYFYKNVKTSDYLNLDYLDYTFDCHNIDEFKSIENNSIDLVILTNVLHHLYDPIHFFKSLKSKLIEGAIIIALEPYLSFFSYPIYKIFHYEPINLKITQPKLLEQDGPLSTANVALPYLLFIKRKEWSEPLRKDYIWDKASISYFSFLSYFATGGISSKFKIPRPIYRLLFYLDLKLANLFPRIFASFFEIKIVYKGR